MIAVAPRIGVMAVLVTALVGCGASGPLYQPVSVPDERAAIYVYRPHSAFQRPGYPNVYVDGKPLYALKNNSYNVSLLPPGRHEVKVSGSLLTNWAMPDAAIAVDAKPGQSIYLRYLPEPSGAYVTGPTTAGVTGKSNFQEVPEANAIREIVNLRRSE